MFHVGTNTLKYQLPIVEDNTKTEKTYYQIAMVTHKYI